MILQLKKLLSNEVELFTTPFKQRQKVFINTVEGVDRALFSQLVEVRKKVK